MFKRKGFTLIELVIVCSILAILVSIVVVGYGQYIQKAKSLKGLNGGTQVYNAFMWYYRENKNNLTSSIAISYIEKVMSYDITSLVIDNKEPLAIKIKYKYEGEDYDIEIHPERSEYFIKHEGKVLTYQ